jgi:uncharacterized membrane protein YhaH (DUF805 family)
MSPLRAIGRGFKNYGNFTGRATRMEFWWWTALNLAFIFAGYAYALWWSKQPHETSGGDLQIFVGTLTLWGLIFVIPDVSMAARRLNDAGVSGLWGLCLLVPWVGLLSIVAFGLLPSKSEFENPPVITAGN